MDDSGYGTPSGTPSKIDENRNTDDELIKIKLIRSNMAAMCNSLAPYEISASKNQTLAAAIKAPFTKFAVERRLYWTEVEGHDGEVAVNPFSLLCRWLKLELETSHVKMETNEIVKYNKEFDVVGKSNLFHVKTDDRHKLAGITDIPCKFFKGKDICVAAMEGDTFREAFERDGRFIRKKIPMFKLHYGADRTSPHMSAIVTRLYHNSVFSVAVKHSPQTDVASSPVSSSVAENNRKAVKSDGGEDIAGESEEEDLTGLYRFSKPSRTLSSKERRDKMREFIKKNARLTLVDRSKRNEYQKEIALIAREQFAHRTNVARPATFSNHIASIYPSVGRIVCGTIQATCFLVAEDMVVTNNHVVEDILECQRYHSDRVGHRSITVDFGAGQNDESCVIDVARLDGQRNIRNDALDYAFLALKSKPAGNKIPLGKRVKRQVPKIGLLSIIGHPQDSKVLLDDTAVIIPKDKRFHEISIRTEEQEIKCLENPQECIRVNHDVNGNVKCIHLYNPTVNIAAKNDVIASYDTSTMFHGSSGSPVVNMSGDIVAIHSCGYMLHESRATKTSLLEYGFTFDAIIHHLVEQGEHERVKSWFPYCDQEDMDES